MNPFTYTLSGTEGAARIGALCTPHGSVPTPAFMPVGTNGAVKTLSPLDLRNCGATMVLANTYHLHLRPGEATVQALGELHGFMAWNGPILTDSGGFQVFSLADLRHVTDDGVTFRSHIDGSVRHLTPERAIEIQWALGPDVAMALDHVVPGHVERDAAAEALARTTRWLARCRARHATLSGDQPDRQTLWPIVQGASFPDLRRLAAQQVADLGPWTGIAIGGLAVGESKRDMLTVLETLQASLPSGAPRYLMGVGFPEDLLRAIARGVDLFDCVVPTRNGRRGSAFTLDGLAHLRNVEFQSDSRPLDETCDCETCTVYSRGYVSHLIRAKETLGMRLLSLHNVRFLIRLTEQAQRHIAARTFDTWSSDWLRRYLQRGQS